MMSERMSERVFFGDVPCGDRDPPVFVAEVGSFFNKDVDLALEYLHQVADARASVFKTEILHDPDTVLRGDLTVTYRHAGGSKVENYRALIERKTMPLKSYERLLDAARKLGMPVIATVFDKTGVDFLKDNGAAGIKISRNNINHLVLLRQAGESGLPVVLDTGEVYFWETARAVELLQAIGAPIVVNHHPGANPSPASIHNMRVIGTYREAFGIPVGLACHYRGQEMLYVAVACGACLLEKGVVDDPNREDADLVSALSFGELKEAVGRVRECWDALGDGRLRVPVDRNLDTRTGLMATTDLNAGDTLSLAVASFAWPPIGISPEHWERVEGWRLRAPVKKGYPIVWDLVVPVDRA